MCEYQPQISKYFLSAICAPHCVAWKENFISLTIQDNIIIIRFILKPFTCNHEINYEIFKILPKVERFHYDIQFNPDTFIANNIKSQRTHLLILDKSLYTSKNSIIPGHCFIRCEISPTRMNEMPLIATLSLDHELCMHVLCPNELNATLAFNLSQKYYELCKALLFKFPGGDQLPESHGREDKTALGGNLEEYKIIQTNLICTSMQWIALDSLPRSIGICPNVRTHGSSSILFSVMESGSVVVWLMEPWLFQPGPSLPGPVFDITLPSRDWDTNGETVHKEPCVHQENLNMRLLARIDGIDIIRAHVSAVNALASSSGSDVSRVWTLIALGNKCGRLTVALTLLEWATEQDNFRPMAKFNYQPPDCVNQTCCTNSLAIHDIIDDMPVDAILLRPLDTSNVVEIGEICLYDYILITAKQFAIFIHVLRCHIPITSHDVSSSVDYEPRSSAIEVLSTHRHVAKNLGSITGMAFWGPTPTVLPSYQHTCILASQDGIAQTLRFSIHPSNGDHAYTIEAGMDEVDLKDTWTMATNSDDSLVVKVEPDGNDFCSAPDPTVLSPRGVAMYDGLAVSPDGSYLVTVSRPKVFYDHLVLKRPIQLSFYQLSATDSILERFINDERPLAQCLDNCILVQCLVNKSNNYGQTLTTLRPIIDTIYDKDYTIVPPMLAPTDDDPSVLMSLVSFGNRLNKINYMLELLYHRFHPTEGNVMNVASSLDSARAHVSLSHLLISNAGTIAVTLALQAFCRASATLAALMPAPSCDTQILELSTLALKRIRDALTLRLPLVQICRAMHHTKPGAVSAAQKGRLEFELRLRVGLFVERCVDLTIYNEDEDQVVGGSLLNRCPLCGIESPFTDLAYLHCTNNHKIPRCPYSFIPLGSFPAFQCVSCASYARYEIWDPYNPILVHILIPNPDIVPLSQQVVDDANYFYKDRPRCLMCGGSYVIVESDDFTPIL